MNNSGCSKSNCHFFGRWSWREVPFRRNTVACLIVRIERHCERRGCGIPGRRESKPETAGDLAADPAGVGGDTGVHFHRGVERGSLRADADPQQ